MPTPPMSRDAAQRIVETVEQCLREGFLPAGQMPRAGQHGSISEAFDRLGLARSNNGSLKRAEAIYRPVDWALYNAPERAVERRQQADVVTGLRDQVRALEKALTAERSLRTKMETTFASFVPPLPWASKPAVKKQTILTPVLFTSDFQCGEVIKPAEIDGINEFSQAIFAARYQAMIDKMITLAERHTGATGFEGCYYLRGGDAISGSIHDELAETNDLSAVPAVRFLQQQERAGIKRLRDKFGRVRVISIPGNHGRTTPKPRSKRYGDLNFETLLAWWLADGFSDDPRVEFWMPASGDAWFDVAGWKVLMSHGDRMGSRGGQGFVGPAATIARGHRRLYDNWTRTGKSVDVILTGHLHTSLKLELGYANGALAGYSEYARDLRATPDAPKQWGLFFDRQHMVSHAFELLLGPLPKRIPGGPDAWQSDPSSSPILPKKSPSKAGSKRRANG